MKRPLASAAFLAALATIAPAFAQTCPAAGGCSAANGCYGYKCGPGYGAQGDTCEEAYIDNAIWPRQYIGPARRGICQATALMVHNGWRRQNLLGKYYFDESGEKLSEAGRLKVEWIMTQAPPQHRVVYIERSPEADLTARHTEAVQQFAANAAALGGSVDVQETHVRDEGHPAGAVDAVFTGFSQNQRTPQLPSASGSTTAGSASSASNTQK
jgi:hypothetical protein